MATPGIAAGAYARMAQVTNPVAGVSRTIGGGDEAGQSFGAVLKDALASVRQAGAKSDAQAQLMAAGTSKANINVIGATRRMIQRTLDILKS